jgi:hypothetical protein
MQGNVVLKEMFRLQILSLSCFTAGAVRAEIVFDSSWQRWSYGFEGKAVDGDELRVIVVVLEQLGIVTIVRLGDNYEKEFGSI